MCNMKILKKDLGFIKFTFISCTYYDDAKRNKPHISWKHCLGLFLYFESM